MIAAFSARRGRHCLAPPVRCPGRRRRRGPCREIYAAPYSCPRGRVENNTSESAGDEGTT